MSVTAAIATRCPDCDSYAVTTSVGGEGEFVVCICRSCCLVWEVRP